MKSLQKIMSWILAAMSMAILSSVFADPLPAAMWLDEYGNGYNMLNRLPSAKVADPTGGVAEPVLMYFLPWQFKPTPGDVVLTHAGGGPWSDVIRFAFLVPDPSAPSIPVMIYYSNGSDGVGLPADVHSMPTLMANQVVLTEGAGDFTQYQPEANQPGFIPFVPSLAFYGENVAFKPFPDDGMTVLLLCIGIAGVLAMKRVITSNARF